MIWVYLEENSKYCQLIPIPPLPPQKKKEEEEIWISAVRYVLDKTSKVLLIQHLCKRHQFTVLVLAEAMVSLLVHSLSPSVGTRPILRLTVPADDWKIDVWTDAGIYPDPTGGVITPQFSCDTPPTIWSSKGVIRGVFTGGCLCDRDGMGNKRGQKLTWTNLFTSWNK